MSNHDVDESYIVCMPNSVEMVCMILPGGGVWGLAAQWFDSTLRTLDPWWVFWGHWCQILIECYHNGANDSCHARRH